MEEIDSWGHDSVQNQFKGTWKCSLAFNVRLSHLSMHTRSILNSCQVTVVVVNINCWSRSKSELYWIGVAGSGNVAHRVQKESIENEEDWGSDSSVAIILYTNTTKEVAGLRENSWLIVQGQEETPLKETEKKWHLEKGLRTREKGLRFFLLSF